MEFNFRVRRKYVADTFYDREYLFIESNTCLIMIIIIKKTGIEIKYNYGRKLFIIGKEEEYYNKSNIVKDDLCESLSLVLKDIVSFDLFLDEYNGKDCLTGTLATDESNTTWQLLYFSNEVVHYLNSIINEGSNGYSICINNTIMSSPAKKLCVVDDVTEIRFIKTNVSLIKKQLNTIISVISVNE